MAGRKKSRSLRKNPVRVRHRIGLTTGDPEGIGFLTAKMGLKRLGPKKNFQFLLWTDKNSPRLRVPAFQVKTVSNGEEALKAPFSESLLLQIRSPQRAGEWVETCARLCLNHSLSAMVTGPLSKGLLAKTHLRLKGQTQLLRYVSGTKSVFMGFLGRNFNVILLNDHVPFFQTGLKNLPELLREGLKFRKFLSPDKQNKPLGLLGLNPHAGEGGLLGSEERDWSFLSSFSEDELIGPLTPDGAFLRKNWRRFSFYVALYHDQGLIPFKMIHPHKGVSVSVGLPFIRTGVDHGTGLGLKPREVSSDSFLSAIKKAIFLVKKNQSL